MNTNTKRIAATALTLAILTLPGCASRDTYRAPARVSNVSDDYVVTFETEDGNLWDWEEEYDEFREGARVVLTMNTNNTETIYDDAIVSIARA